MPPGPVFGAQRRKQRSVRLISLIGLTVLAAGAIGVVVFLPDRIGEPAKKLSVPPSAPAPTAPAPFPAASPAENRAENPAASIDLKAEAAALLEKILKQQVRLENDGVQIWGKETLKTSYPEALALLAKANENFEGQNFGPATDGFRTTLALFDQLAAGKDERFRTAMDAGAASLRTFSSAEATRFFQLALALRPGDDGAAAGLRRAGNLPRVTTLMNEGRQQEKTGNLDEALKAYRAAAELDREFAEARENADRVRAQIIERDYRKSISRALAALDSEKYRAAALALTDARKLRPSAPEIRDLEQRLRAGQQLATISALRTQALARESAEDWKGASALYEKILAIDPSISFAVDGKSRSVKNGELTDRIDTYLGQPDRLQSPEPLQQARQILDIADSIADAGPRLREKRDRLRALVAAVDQPRPVLLKSDGSTLVTLYRVARFGVLREQRLSLRPGRYIAVGSRAGYRDVRVEFQVPPSGEETVVVIICNERI